MIDNYKIGNYITLLRKEKGLTGEKLAEILNISPQAVSKWENGKCLPETSLLPLIATTLGTSIDTLLMPRELLILSAIYSDGVKEVDVTQTVNNYVKGNVLNITVNQQFLGIVIESPRIKVLTLKYQTPQGIFYEYAVENMALFVDLQSIKYSSNFPFKIISAYYGNNNDFRPVLQKIQHYDYFKWNEINVNHENFPSSVATNDPEYLTLIYINRKGIHTISCEENETLSYSKDRTFLYLKDTSFCILPEIMILEWENEMDCTWAGAAYAALRFMGEPYSYVQLMGMSGACYRIAFTEIWDWSAVDALVATDYSSVLFKAIGYEQIWSDRIEKDERNPERNSIVNDIKKGKPVLAINLRIAPEWGVITGYRDNGKILLCRTYFDKEYLNENNDYLESDFWPFLITHFGEKIDKPSTYDTFMASLKVMVESFHASCERGYFQGKQAYEKWIEGLQDESQWDSNNSNEDIERRLGVNDSMLLNLIDARRCAYYYLKENMNLIKDKEYELCAQNMNMYQQIYNRLYDFRKKLLESKNDELKYNTIKTKSDYSFSFRYEQANLLSEILALESLIVTNSEIIIE